jgi:hypothetical protein
MYKNNKVLYLHLYIKYEIGWQELKFGDKKWQEFLKAVITESIDFTRFINTDDKNDKNLYN